MNRLIATAALAALVGLLLLAGPADAATGPLYDIRATWGPTNLPPGGTGQFTLQVRNLGDEVAEKKLFISDELPAGVEVEDVSWRSAFGDEELTPDCSGSGSLVSCVVPASVTPEIAQPPNLKATSSIINPTPSGYLLPIFIDVKIDSSVEGTGVNRATVSGGGAPSEFTDEDQVPFDATPSPFGVVAGSFLADVFKKAYPDTAMSRQAGDHPFEQRISFDLSATTRLSSFDGTLETPTNGSVRTFKVELPRGLVGNPQALPRCSPARFAQIGVTNNATRCPPDTQVGYIDAYALAGEGNHGNGIQVFMPDPSALLSRVPLYNLVPPKGTPVDFGFNANALVIGHIYAVLDPAKHYAIKALVPNISTAADVRGSDASVWGVPGDPAHGKFRYFSRDPLNNPENLGLGAPFGATIRPFFSNPMDCGVENGGAQVRIDSYEHPEEFSEPQENPDPLNVTGCDDPRFRFEPEITLQPTDRHAGAPTGLNLHLKVPQRNDEVEEANELYAENGLVKGISSPPIKKIVVTLPEGMTLNPSAGQGLASCTPEQIGLGTEAEVKCPEASQYGTLRLHTPALPIDAQPEGHIYIGSQEGNPFHVTLYLVVEEPKTGILVKLAGRAELDPRTGRVKTTFDDLPQFPVSDTELSLKGGVRAGLVEPSTCGTETMTAEFFSWHEPSNPITVNNAYEITEKPDNSPCVRSLAERPFKPLMEAGASNDTAGEYSPFVFRLTRTDEDQEFSQVGVSPPPGLTAKFAGVGQCSDTAIAQAEGRKEAGEGTLEQMSPSCPVSSLIGSTEVGAGVGVSLTYVSGKVYLAGPYRGAPLSMVAISPAVVGPFDLGVVVVRTAIKVNPETARATASSDPFPQLFQGIPVRIRDIRLNLDRPNFTLDPTSCAAKQVEAHITGAGGDIHSTADDTGADVASPFQAVDCASLGFKPKLTFRLAGGTKRGGHPRLHALVTYPKKGAYSNIAAASVALPRSEFLDQAHIGTVCTRVQFAAKQCPAASIYGEAVAKSPLFDFPLSGPVYLRSSSHELPDVVAALRGPASMPVEVDLDGRVDSVNGGIRNTFEVVPDAPVEWFKLALKGARKGLLINSQDICAKVYRATAKLTAQNGKRLTLRPAMKANCPKAPRRQPQ